jgi:hypothetical protein
MAMVVGTVTMSNIVERRSVGAASYGARALPFTGRAKRRSKTLIARSIQVGGGLAVP